MSNNVSNALNLLSVYNSDTDSDNEITGPRVSVKRSFRDENNHSTKIAKTDRLPVPSMLKEAKKCVTDQNYLHGGRIRSFPHARGNWSTYIYISYERNDVIEDLVKEITLKCKSFLILQPCHDFHISLTKTVILKHHWIESFTKTVAENLVYTPWFLILFDKLNVYCNEEKTRTFIGLQIKTGHDSLLNLVKMINKCLKEFNLPEFYKDPSFHMSLLWCVGDYVNTLNNIIEELNVIVEEFMTNHSQHYWYIHVKNLICKTGNKYYNFNLTQSI